MIRCVIIDDEPLAIEILETYLRKLQGFELVRSFVNPVEAFNFVQNNDIDLLFLDVEMPVFNGLDFIRTLKRSPKIIITTAYRDYAVDSFELEALDYLVKPIAFQRFLKAVSKLTPPPSGPLPGGASKSSPLPEEDIWLKVDKKLVRVPVSDIYFIESLKDYIRVKTNWAELITYQTLNGIMEKLPPAQFVRIHKSYIVALGKIDMIEGNTVIVRGSMLPVGRSFRQELLEYVRKSGSPII